MHKSPMMASLWALRLEVMLISASALLAFFYLTTSQYLFIRLHLDNADHGAVASESKTCTRIGIDLLKSGGNAADAVGHTFHMVLQGRTLIRK